MGKKKKRKKRKSSSSDPIQCTACKECEGSMKEIAPNHHVSRYVCRLTNNEVPMKPFILIPKWCPKGYKNLFDY